MDIREEAPVNGNVQVSRAAVFDEMDRAHVEAGRAERRRLKSILECDRHDLWRGHGARDHAEFLAGRYGLSKWKARRMIAAAYTLEHLPLTAHALETGALNLDKVVELTRFATPATEPKLITWAKRVTPGGIRARADEETRRALKEVQRDEGERSLSWWSHEHGLEIEGRLTHEAGAAFTAAIDKQAAELPDLPSGDEMRVDENRSLDQRRADALFLLCTQGGDATDGARPTVVVHAPLDTMTTSTKSALTEDGRPLHPTTAQRLACEGHIDVVLYDRDRVADMGPVLSGAVAPTAPPGAPAGCEDLPLLRLRSEAFPQDPPHGSLDPTRGDETRQPHHPLSHAPQARSRGRLECSAEG